MSGPLTPVPAPAPGRPARSLRWRLLVATLVALLVALGLAGLLLSELFRSHVMRQSVEMLTAQLDQVTARLEFGADGRPAIDAATLSDPRWSRPQSGLYWQVDGEGVDAGRGAGRAVVRGVLRSRSLWDATLQLPTDELPAGRVHVHELTGPRGEPLLAVERMVREGGAQGGEGDGGGASGAGGATGAGRASDVGGGRGPGAARWRLVVAADLAATRAAIDRFVGVLAASLAGLLLLLGAAGWAQVTVGLAPLRALQRAVAAVRDGQAPRLAGPVPEEVQPLVDDFNTVLARNAELVERARTQAGNLAHALKTPLAVLRQAADAARAAAGEGGGAAAPRALAELPPLVLEQVDRAQRHVDWHLARSRAAAARGLPGARAPVAPLLAGLVRVMAKVHAARGVSIELLPVDERVVFAGEGEDLQEIAGNVIDNACKWARTHVRVSARTAVDAGAPRLALVVEDDGPGIAAAERARVVARGARLDEAVPGSGLGLSIAQDLVALYGGTLELLGEPPAGLEVRIHLPAAGAAQG